MIDYFDHRQPRHLSTRDIIQNQIGIDNVILSAITKMELIAGAFNKSELALLNKNILWFDVALINPDITVIALQLIEKYKLAYNLQIPDALIAATALYKNVKLFTYNLKDYRYINHLQLFNPISL
ncbi:PIN domain-containing protein [Mucilaginibacter mali]|uniref:PIN domain-containing protein n=2 Tax=Mucilaginibacter mali TaxID=2740462 RepID=A0A7D4UFT9_9SPHI|nr:PIN domain-containing protein [Mucilaginibacter mali]